MIAEKRIENEMRYENRRKESVFLSNNVRGPEESLGTRRPWVAAAKCRC